MFGVTIALRPVRLLSLAFLLWLIAGVPLCAGETKSLEELRDEIVHRHISITFLDESTADAIVEEINPTSLSLRIAKTSNARVHPRGKAQITISAISKLTYMERENLAGRILRTAVASALTLGILSPCTWRSQPYAVAVEGAASSQTPLTVTPFDLPGCEP